MDWVLWGVEAGHSVSGNPWLALLTLTAMEIVLGIDNIVFISIVTSKLPPASQPKARQIGLLLAMGMRIGLLFTITWIMGLTKPLFEFSSLGLNLSLFTDHPEVNQVTGRDLVLFFGGLFLIAKSVTEIHEKLEPPSEHHAVKAHATFTNVLVQIMILDIIFSLDSVITAVGMTGHLWVMVLAVILSVTVMMIFASPISNFVSRHPTLKMLALSFLILIGVMLVAEGLGQHIHKGYIYFAMAFALGVEALNLRMKVIHDTLALGNKSTADR